MKNQLLLQSGDYEGTYARKGQPDEDDFFRSNEQDNEEGSQQSSNNPNDDCSLVDDISEDNDIEHNQDQPQCLQDKDKVKNPGTTGIITANSYTHKTTDQKSTGESTSNCESSESNQASTQTAKAAVTKLPLQIPNFKSTQNDTAVIEKGKEVYPD